jgi:hypothetical protein
LFTHATPPCTQLPREIFRERQHTRKRASSPVGNFVRLWLLCAAFAALA